MIVFQRKISTSIFGIFIIFYSGTINFHQNLFNLLLLSCSKPPLILKVVAAVVVEELAVWPHPTNKPAVVRPMALAVEELEAGRHLLTQSHQRLKTGTIGVTALHHRSPHNLRHLVVLHQLDLW